MLKNTAGVLTWCPCGYKNGSVHWFSATSCVEFENHQHGYIYHRHTGCLLLAKITGVVMSKLVATGINRQCS